MFKAAWFQIHWFIGITAGIVLAVVGVTGGLLSFEHEILKALNPGVMTVSPGPGEPLAPADLIARIAERNPGRTITGLAVSSHGEDAARVTFAPDRNAPAGPGGRPSRGETLYANPYTGDLLGTPSGQEAMRFIMQVHRWLAAGDVGKQIVGASTIALIVLSASGLYLRWPRRPLSWRPWARLDLSRRGRSLLWELHSVIGTWVLPFYLLASLTGLYWSYDWYRSFLFDITGAPRPQQQRPQGATGGAPGNGGPAASGAPAGTRQGGGPGERAPARPEGAPEGRHAPGGTPDLARLWPVFVKESGGFKEANIRLGGGPGGGPGGGAPGTLTISYLAKDAPHDRATSTLVIEGSGNVREHRRYGEQPFGHRIMQSIFALHSGSYFGLIGLILMMIASLLMPLFAVTGWMLYLNRRARKTAARAAAGALAGPEGGQEPVLVAYASQTGTAERLAFRSAGALKEAGTPARVAPLSGLEPGEIAGARRALFVVSTFGEGEPPDAARAFARRMARQAAGEAPGLKALEYGLLALGDRSYERYCGFGHDLDRWLRTQGARPLFDRIEVDREDKAALARWQSQLGALFGAAAPDWSAPAYGRWRLVERRVLNPGSSGLPTFHVALEPVAGTTADWQAGDIAQIAPRNDPAQVEAFLSAHGLKGEAAVSGAAGGTLAERLAASALPGAPGEDAGALAASLRPLPHRDYSIASIPQDGRIELIVRQARDPVTGALGLGSGWLTRHAPEGAEIDLAIRPNPSFHGPEDDRPLLLIGNGTGLAGLRAHLKARIHAGRAANWLIFGERNAAHDFYHRDEILGWQASGGLSRLDLAFSRDQNERIYVQDRLKAAEGAVRGFIAQGAAIYVCGAAIGMAQAVDQVLRDIIGAAELDALAEARRYCRDVY